MLIASGGRFVSPLDDAYIYQQYARQIASGYPARYNSQDPPTSGFSSLSYPAILALGYLVGFRDYALSLFTFLLGSLLLVVSALLTYRVTAALVHRLAPSAPSLPRKAGLVAGFAFLLNGAILWGYFNGLESGLFFTLLLLSLDNLLAERRGWALLFLVGMAITRSVGSVLVALLVGIVILQRILDRSSPTLIRLRWVPTLLLAVAAQPAVYWALTGTPTPTGVLSKSWLFNVPFNPIEIARWIGEWYLRSWIVLFTGIDPDEIAFSLQQYGAPILGWGYMPPGLAIAGLIYLWLHLWRELRQRRPGLISTITLWLVVGMLAVSTLNTAFWHHHRYFLPFYAITLIAGVVGLAGLLGQPALRDAPRPARLWGLGGAVILLLSLPSVPLFVWGYGQAVTTTSYQQIRMAQWIDEHLPPQVRLGVADAGALRYFSNHYTYDVVGLTTPGASLAWRSGSGAVFERMENAPNRPTHFAIYNDSHFLPYFVGTDIFAKELFRAQAPHLSWNSSASDTQYVYAADWRLANSGDRPYQPDILKRVQSLTMVDFLDIADLAEEAAHNYEWHLAPGLPAGFPTEFRQLRYRHPREAEVMDGGRLLTGGESFRIATRPGLDLHLVGRFHAISDVALRVSVDGIPVGEWRYPSLPGEWQESLFTVPGRMVRGNTTTISLEADHHQPGFRSHSPYYYWFYQGTLPESQHVVPHPRRSSFGPAIELLGYDYATSKVRAGETFLLTLYWTARMEPTSTYKVFVHISDPAGKVAAQHDGQPYYGLRPTRLWKAGEVIIDPHPIPIPADLAPGTYPVLIGMYEPTTLERLPASGADRQRRLLLTRITVLP
jgi:hypothetical protein